MKATKKKKKKVKKKKHTHNKIKNSQYGLKIRKQYARRITNKRAADFRE